jgi:4-amino-4-deoxy-L-arabinose transferase-like glycosyltransferase
MTASRPDAVSLPVLIVLTVAALVARLWIAPSSTEGNMDPDAAHFLNIARSFARGEGFVNPAAWPAWIQPARLPMPETFKEPGYPWLIALLHPVTGWFRAGQWISLAAGTLLPWATYALGRRRGLERHTALLAAGLVAASPLLLVQSVRVMVDACFALVVTLLFVAASTDLSSPHVPRRGWARAAVAGALFGAAFLLRAQTLFLLLPLLVLLVERRSRRAAMGAVAVAAVFAVLVASPLWMRNLRLFGTPLYSDVVAYGLWPYVDHLTFSHGLEHPPAIAPFVLAHVPQVIAHMARSLGEFARFTLPETILGNPVWMLALAAGVVIAWTRPRAWAFAAVYLVGTLVFIFAVHWDARYFTSGVPLWCLLAAPGAMWFVDAVAEKRVAGIVAGRTLLALGMVVVLASQVAAARREVRTFAPPELAAAREQAPFLEQRLAPGEAVLAVTTSYWSWFADRPSVHLVIADEARFDAIMDRLRVRWAALPTSRLAEFAARYPERRLPASLVFDHADAAHDVTVFAVRTEGSR